jgi:hypothetical protein
MYSLVCANTSGFQRFGTQLFIFVRHHVYAKRKLVDICPLASEVEDANLGIWYTAVES